MNNYRKVILALGAANLAWSGLAQADIVQNDDVISTFSHCVGNDCNNGESFGFDTIRMKENNVRLHFDDTSTSASFPRNDWRLIANDSSNGGASYLAIEDSTAGRIPFRVEAGAAANSLVVEADGDIGIGTLDPVVELHIRDGDSPTVRIEQDGSSGFTPQTWDMAGNEANFFIRDVTNGSNLAFRIKPGSGTDDAIVIAADGKVGLGTDTPDSDLDIQGSGPELRFTDPATTGIWELGDAGDASFKISHPGEGPAVEFRLNREGLMHLNTVATPPTSNVVLGAIYNDTSGALCWYDGSSWQKIVGSGTCN